MGTTAIPKVSGPRPFKWTRVDYHRLAADGYFADAKVELLEGVIYKMSPKLGVHSQATILTYDALREAFGAGFLVRNQEPLNLGSSSEPEPDLSVVKGSARDYPDHPTSALLVVEISLSTLEMDRKKKGSLYARAGIAEYWIVNLERNVLEIRREPRRDPTEKYDYGYSSVVVLRADEFASPLANPDVRIQVAALLPDIG